MKNILIVSATEFEAKPLQKKITEENKFTKSVDFLITGPGQVLTTYHLSKALSEKKYDLVINIGICGAYQRSLELGQVVEIVEERFGDWGATDADGTFLPMETLGFWNPNTPPFTNGRLSNPNRISGKLYPTVKGLTLNTASGHQTSIDQQRNIFPDAQVESMEGAAIALVCAYEQMPYIQLRAISNYVEARDRNSWEIGLAIENVNEAVWQFLKNG